MIGNDSFCDREEACDVIALVAISSLSPLTAGRQFSLHTQLLLLLHPFNGPLSGTTKLSRYQKVKTNLDFTEARDREWQWHQLGHMQVCTSLQTDNHSVFTGRMPFLPPNQQRQSTPYPRKYFIFI